MDTARSTARAAARWLLLPLLAGGALGALWASPVSAADNTLTSSSPAADSTVEGSPSTITLTFAAPLGTDNRVEMTCGPTGGQPAVVTLGTPVLLADQLTLQVPVPTPVGKGVCNVAWQVSDPNLQPAGSGSFSFAVANDPVVTTTAPPTTAPATTGTGGGTADTAAATTAPATTVAPSGGGSGTNGDAGKKGTSSEGPLGLFRWLSTLGLAVVFGSLVVIAVAWPEGVEYILTVRFLRFAWLFTIVATFLFAGALSADIGGDSLGSSLVPTGWGNLLDTGTGKATVLRLVLVLAAGYVVLRPERAIDPATQAGALGPAGLAVVTLAFSRPEFGLIDWVAGAVHALAMAVWIGGLILLTRVVLAGPGDEDLVHAVRGFARLSAPALGLTVLTGAVQLWRLDRGGLDSSHGLVMIVKVLLVALMVFVGVAARQFINQRVTRAAAMTAPLAQRLRRALGIEAVVGVVILALSAWLLALAPPGLAAGAGPHLDLGQAHEFQNESLGTDVLVSFSEKVGVNDVRIEVVAPPAGLSNLAVDFLPPPGSAANGMTIDAIPLTGPGVAVLEKRAGFSLDAAGNWTVQVRIGTNVVAQQSVYVGDSSAATTTPST